ncbi:uncharacterized protein ACNS7B_002646 [Menidia menidia]
MAILEALLQSLSLSSLLGGFVVLLCVYLMFSRFQAEGKEPPGPRTLPLLGNILQIDLKSPSKTLMEYYKKYGSIFQIHFGPKKVVVLAGYETVKEALVKFDEEFGYRDIPDIMYQVNKGHGVLWSNGDSWREMRRFALTNLRDFGMGKKACEDKILEECQHLLEVFKRFKRKPFETTMHLNCAVSNIICSMVYGNRFEYDDPEFTSLVDRTNRSIQLTGSASLEVYSAFPLLSAWFGPSKEYLNLVTTTRKQNSVLLNKLRETLNPQMCRGFVDAYLVRQQQLEESGATDSHFHDSNLLVTVSNLFNAGTETTSTTLRWGLLLMAKYPKIQAQVQEEVRRVMGDRQVQLADRKNMPFTNAVIHETQRLASIVPTSVPHRTTKDITFHGYFIKKGTTVYPFLTSVLHDPREWEKPHSFHPAHFLDKDGNFTKPDAFIPFSAGRRVCLGESLAKMELFLFFTTLLQHFRFTAPPGVREEELDLTPCGGITLSPVPHKLCAVSLNYSHIMALSEVLLQSFSLSSLLGALAVLLLIYLASSSFRSPKQGKEPPGPTPLPVLGNLLQIDLKRPYNTLMKYSKEYGSIFTVHFGPKKVVVLAGYETVKEALVKHDEEFGGRDAIKILEDINKGHGVLWSNGDSWREMRRFALTNLRDFGMGKKACEDKIVEECQHLLEVFKRFKGKPFETTMHLNCAVSNIICSMVYGNRFEYDDPEFTSLVDQTNRGIQLTGSPSILASNLFPWMFKWIGKSKEFLDLIASIRKRNIALLSRLRETLNPQMCRGFVDAFLVRQQQLEESGATNSHFHDSNLLVTVSNLFNAGTETTSTTLRWGLLLMAKYPKIQAQVQEEVRRVMGDRQVQLADRKNMPFTNAVIHETQRLASIVPTSVPHRTTKDITFHGYFIKKGTTVYPFLTSVLHDPREWEKPHSFHPAHFLDKDGNFTKPDAFIPFSAGRRVCLGESLAKMELFLFFTTLLQHFRFTAPPGVTEGELDLTPCGGITLSPVPHKLCAVSLN